ncbi:hypothetical protein [Luteipulveratus flavus]|uniref:Uncharacterized protein n=1 Tax=Luteipulveratus flavus TaxID=3031728 RepID=A0ABT6C2C7_9MICO|nr:hypothetical protein [Luteipulveratus sp. YIM 133296]MDF8262940.1 hypothetical protein [Luteipulveratus sp. YIM 133296]
MSAQTVHVGVDVDRDTHPDAARSYLADGRGVAWDPPGRGGCRLAVDAELAAQRVPGAVVRRARLTEPVEPQDFWARWTRAEVLAKLLDVPILLWVREHGLLVPDLGAEAVAWRTYAWEDLVVTFAVRGPQDPAD